MRMRLKSAWTYWLFVMSCWLSWMQRMQLFSHLPREVVSTLRMPALRHLDVHTA